MKAATTRIVFSDWKAKGMRMRGKSGRDTKIEGAKVKREGEKKTQQVSRMRETYRMKENKSSEH